MIGVDTVLIFFVLIVGFYMAWNIGANDVANAMGTSVGSGALTLKRAVILAAVLEFSGAFFLGSNVSQTIQRGLVNPEFFNNDPTVLILGMLAALLATAIWLQVASFFGWPVSTTHAIVGAILGFGALIGGLDAVQWTEVLSIAISWVVSPGLSALISYLIFTLLQRRILYAMNPIEASRKLIPYLATIVLFTFTLSLILSNIRGHKLDLALWQSIAIAMLVGCIAFVVSYVVIRRSSLPDFSGKVPQKHLSQNVASLNKAIKHLKRVRLSTTGSFRVSVSKILVDTEAMTEEIREKSGYYQHTSDYQVVEKMFVYLQILSAAFVAFAHGANDVANAIGPVAAVLEIIKKGKLSMQTHTPTWLLVLGGVGIVIGLATWGWRVIETIGRKITELTPTRGFSAEFGAATTILIASKLGFPISTTHCIVGGVLGVGLARGITAINLRTLREIVLSWVVTLPTCAILSILLFYLLKAIFHFFFAVV